MPLGEARDWPAGRLPRGSAGPSSEDGKRETLRPAAGESGRVKTPKVLPRLSPGSPPGFFFVRATARGAPRRAGFAEGQRDCNSQGLVIRSLGAANGPEAGHTLFEGRGTAGVS